MNTQTFRNKDDEIVRTTNDSKEILKGPTYIRMQYGQNVRL
jgi:hypothetical protein